MTRAILLLLSLLLQAPFPGAAGVVSDNSEQGVRVHRNVRPLRHRTGNRKLRAWGARGDTYRLRKMEQEDEATIDEDNTELALGYDLSRVGANDVRRRKKKGSSDSRKTAKIQRSLSEGDEVSSFDETFMEGGHLNSIDVPDTGADTSVCSNAIVIEVGSTVHAEVTHTLDQSSVEDCEGGYELNNPFVQVLGMWFSVEGTGGVLRASSCPALISVYQGEDCYNSTCAESASHQGVPCHVEWQSSPGQVDFILVQMIELSEGDGGYEIPAMLSVIDTSEGSAGDEVAGSALSDETASSGTLLPFFDDQTLGRCAKATKVSEGRTIDVDLGIGTPAVGHCDGKAGFVDLDDVGVEVSEAWFALEGDGREVRAVSCPARVTIISGQDCNRLLCTKLVQNNHGCEVDWRTEPGRTDFILVQTIDYVSGDESFVGPISLTIEALDEDPGKDTEENEEDVSETPTSEVSNEPLPSHLDRCQEADLVSPGEEVQANAVEISGVAAKCSHTFSLEGFDAPVIGAWFSVAGTGGTLKANACPARISVFTGTCDSLSCVDSETNEFGCETEWQSSDDGKLDYILVQTIGFEGEDGFVLPVTLSVADPNLEPTDTLRDPSQVSVNSVGGSAGEEEEGSGANIVVVDVDDEEGGEEEQDKGGTTFVFIDAFEDGCIKAESIGTKESVYVPFDSPIDDFADCKELANDDNLSAVGSWFTVESQTKKTLRASACPGAQIFVYEGECGDLKCVNTREVDDSNGCEIEWKPGRRGAQQHILVHRPSRYSSNDPVVLFLEEA